MLPSPHVWAEGRSGSDSDLERNEKNAERSKEEGGDHALSLRFDHPTEHG